MNGFGYEDIPRLYTAVAEWGACMVYILAVLKYKMTKSVFFLAAAFSLVIQCLILVLTGNLPTPFWIPCMVLAVVSMYLFLYYCSREKAVVVGYYCARAFLLAELAASFEWQIHCFIFYNQGWNRKWLSWALLILVYGVVLLLGWFLERNQKGREVKDISGRELWSAVLIVTASFAFSNLSFIYEDTPFSSRLTADIFNIRTLADLGGFAVLYAFQSRIGELNAARELNSIQAILKSQYRNYLQYQESFDMINMKYHDLKHQIEGLRAETDHGRRMEWLDEMEKGLEIYETVNRTGNKVLDTILAGKIMSCQKHKIHITCVADGTLLNSIHVTDICTIFGNALDNAIESVVSVPDREKRLIHLSVSSQKDFIFIQIENYCENKMELNSQLPATTKADRKNHGFGLKSIRYSAEKYGGTMAVDWIDHRFILRLLIPKPDM